MPRFPLIINNAEVGSEMQWRDIIIGSNSYNRFYSTEWDRLDQQTDIRSFFCSRDKPLEPTFRFLKVKRCR